MKYQLADAERVQKQADAGEFQLPSLEQRKHLNKGDWAYITFTGAEFGERVWVEIEKTNRNGSYVGRVHIELMHYNVPQHSRVTFHPKHIYNLLSAEQMKRSDRIYNLMGSNAAYLYQTEGLCSLGMESEPELDERLEQMAAAAHTGGKIATYERPSLTNRFNRSS